MAVCNSMMVMLWNAHLTLNANQAEPGKRVFFESDEAGPGSGLSSHFTSPCTQAHVFGLQGKLTFHITGTYLFLIVSLDDRQVSSKGIDTPALLSPPNQVILPTLKIMGGLCGE